MAGVILRSQREDGKSRYSRLDEDKQSGTYFGGTKLKVPGLNFWQEDFATRGNVLLLGRPAEAPTSAFILGDVPRRLAAAGWSIVGSGEVRRSS